MGFDYRIVSEDSLEHSHHHTIVMTVYSYLVIGHHHYVLIEGGHHDHSILPAGFMLDPSVTKMFAAYQTNSVVYV